MRSVTAQCEHLLCSPVSSQVTEAMKRMHERQNIGKVILLPEPKKEEEKPKSNAEAGENVEKNDAAISEKKEEEVEAEKDWVRVFISRVSFFALLFKEKKKKKGGVKEKSKMSWILCQYFFGNVDGFLLCNMVILWCLCLEHLFVTFK